MSVYFAARDGLIKIGFSENPELRMLGLGVSPLLVIEGDRQTERAMHMRFGFAWSHGEWFRPLPELCDFIKSSWPSQEHQMIPVGKERVAIRAATPNDLREFASEERRRAASDFTARNATCEGAEWLADFLESGAVAA